MVPRSRYPVSQPNASDESGAAVGQYRRLPQYRPEAQIEIPNLFLASDYVRTYTDLATMEGANEAARRAVNCLLLAAGSTAQPAQLWPLTEPEFLKPLQEIDRIRFALGQPHHLA
jgi:uncharacterized protein with NAD-binding domain and iron-sulfur cluster